MVSRFAIGFGFLICGQIATAQFMPGQMAGRGMIAMNPDCAKELKITKDQQKKIDEAIKELQKRISAGDYTGMNMMNPMAAIDAPIEAILDETQKARLEELFIQKNDGFALTDKRVATKLELTEDQIAEIKKIDRESKPELTKLLQNMRSNSDKDKLKAKEKEVSLQFIAVLTPEQAAKFETFKGKPFKFKN